MKKPISLTRRIELYYGRDEHTETLRFMISGSGRFLCGTITLCIYGRCIGIGRWLPETPLPSDFDVFLFPRLTRALHRLGLD